MSGFTHAVTLADGAGGIPTGTIPAGNRLGFRTVWLGAWGDGTNALALGGGAWPGADIVLLVGLHLNGTAGWHQAIGSGIGGMPSIGLPSLGFGSGLGAIDLDGQLPLDLAIGVADNDARVDRVYLCVLDQSSQQVASQLPVYDGSGLPSGVVGSYDIFGSSLAGVLHPVYDGGDRTLFVAARKRSSDLGSVFVLKVRGSAIAPPSASPSASASSSPSASPAAVGTVLSAFKITNGLGGMPLNTIPIGARLGATIVTVGDIDGDGNTDIAVQAVTDADGGEGAGACFIIFMHADGTAKGT